MESFDWRDGERTIHFGRGRVAQAVELLGGPGYTLLTTERAQAAAPAVAAGAGPVVHVRGGRVDEVAGELLGAVGGDRLVALGVRAARNLRELARREPLPQSAAS